MYDPVTLGVAHAPTVSMFFAAVSVLLVIHAVSVFMD